MFSLNNCNVDVNFSEGRMNISRADNKLIDSIEVRDILSSSTGSGTLRLYYVQRKANRSMKHKELLLAGSYEDIFNLQDTLTSLLKERPKRLLVIINPNSGRRKAVRTYEKYVVPLFTKCGVTADIYITSKPKEPTEILRSYNLGLIDGIVAVGGDGLYCECINGLVNRIQIDNKRDLNNHKSDIVPASLPIGIVPAGSGDVIAQYLHGTRCARTAVLHVLLGGQVSSNLVGVYEGGKLLSYSALVLGFGLFGDMMFDCEKFRWMGPTRYNIIPLFNMFKRREIDVEVEYTPIKAPLSPSKSRKFGRQISLPNVTRQTSSYSRSEKAKSTSDLLAGNRDENGKLMEKGRVYAVDSHAIMMKEKSGKMVPHFGQDSLMVYTTHKCSLTDHISQLTKVKDEKPDCYNYEFVSKHEVSAYRVKVDKDVLQKDYYINCDGEFIRLKEPIFDVRLHKRVVQFFGSVD